MVVFKNIIISEIFKSSLKIIISSGYEFLFLIHGAKSWLSSQTTNQKDKICTCSSHLSSSHLINSTDYGDHNSVFKCSESIAFGHQRYLSTIWGRSVENTQCKISDCKQNCLKYYDSVILKQGYNSESIGQCIMICMISIYAILSKKWTRLKLCLRFVIFLAHLSRRLTWAIVIAHRPSSVRRRRPPSVNFHIFNFFSNTAWWILMKLGRDEVLMVPYKCCCFSARSAQGRIQGGAKIGYRGSPSLRNFFFRPEGYSDKSNA